MKRIRQRKIFAFVLIIIIVAVGWYYFYYDVVEEHDLEWYINNNYSIMGLWPHPDDECYTPGILAMAGSKGNKCWVVTLISLDSPPYSENPEVREARIQANNWFEENYLEEYINLNMVRHQPPLPGEWHGYTWSNETIKAAYKAEIEEKRPDILLTFSPYGYSGGVEHTLISDIVTEIWKELSYEPKPKIYWFINTDQGPRSEKHHEDELYPPTDSLNLDVYLDKLGKTYWEAKVELWEQYAPSLGSLKTWLDTPGNLENNDRKEYFIRHK